MRFTNHKWDLNRSCMCVYDSIYWANGIPYSNYQLWGSIAKYSPFGNTGICFTNPPPDFYTSLIPCLEATIRALDELDWY